MNKVLRLMSASVLLLAVGMGTRAEASTILFTDRDAFDLVAQPGPPLAITDVSLRDSGTLRVIYGDVLLVLYDFAGYSLDVGPISSHRPVPL